MTRNYKDTLLLPAPEFSLQGVKDEAAIRAGFTYETAGDGNVVIVLHDGPPYANGDIHMGHALNKILKDFIIRHQREQGVSTRFVPGWDCHGLPIEWQIEKNLIAEGKSKNDYTPVEFRALCREYAAGWVDTQREQFKKLGVMADWDNPYLTMDFKSESKIVRALHSHVLNNEIYTARKPVMWSTVEETALADAEIDHKDIRTTSVFVRFRVDAKTSIVIWTTTPWTIPANRAVAFNPAMEYATYEVRKVGEGSLCTVGDHLALSTKLSRETMEKLNVIDYFEVSKFDPRSVKCEHPLRGLGYEFDVPVISSDHVTDEMGTGFVHIAPEHGPDDFHCWMQEVNEPVPDTVGPGGAYRDDVPLFAGMKVLRPTAKGEFIFEYTNATVVEKMKTNGTLLASEKVLVSYPHSWRSHAPLIYRTTDQWFVSLFHHRYSYKEDTFTVYPKAASTRLEGAINGRPDWLVSRQRTWGTPLALVVNKKSGELLKDIRLFETIATVFEEEGGDAWWSRDLAYFFENSCVELNPDDYEKVMDVLDVWFDSGNSFRLVDIPESSMVVCVEGSDQARGWFGSSFIESMAKSDTYYADAVLMHGFVLDQFGKKMSKSVGNVVDPLVEADKYGTDVLRLWVALSDYMRDIKVGPQILSTAADQYKKVRNSFRFLVGNLKGDWTADDAGDFSYGPLDRHMITRLAEVELTCWQAAEDFKFTEMCKTLLDFCINDLSAFYFDIRKDVLYCDRPDSDRRRACRSVMAHTFDLLARYLSPIIPFTVAEARAELGRDYFYERGDRPSFPPEDFRWADIELTIQMVMAFLETARKEKRIGSGMDAHVFLTLTEEQQQAFKGIDLDDLFRVSQVTMLTGDADVVIERAVGEKCARSRKITGDVGSDPRYPDLSARDADAVAYWDSLQ